MTPEEFVHAVQQWCAAIEQSVPFLVVMIGVIIAGYQKIRGHDRALNGTLDKRIAAIAQRVIHESSSNTPATRGNSSSIQNSTERNIPPNVASNS